MTHAEPTDEMSELAALYALGALTQHDARRIEEHLAEGCEACQAEIEGFEQVAFNLALAAPEVDPPVATRERLMALTERAADERLPTQISIRAGDSDWDHVCEGVTAKLLFVDPVSGIRTSLVKMAAGKRLPPHRHTGIEQFFVIEGDCTVNGELLGPGDYHRAEMGSIHDETSTEFGTMLLLVAPASYEVLDAT